MVVGWQGSIFPTTILRRPVPRVAIPITLDKWGFAVVLTKLARRKDVPANLLYVKLISRWGTEPERRMATLGVNQEELALLHELELPERIRDLGMLKCGWLVTYRHPKKRNLEVVVHSPTKPPKRRTFTIGGSRRRLVAVTVEKIQRKEAVPSMGKTATKKKRAVEEDELDELEALDELDDLEDEDLEDEEDADEPEDEEDEDDEEEEPAPRKSRSKAKKAPAKKSRKRVADDDEDDDEDEDEEPAPKRRSKAVAKKEKAAGKKSSAKKGSSKKRQPPATRPLPEGRYGPQDIAEEADVDARTVRIFLRAHEDEFPKDEESFRYSFTKRDMQRIAKAIKRDRA